MNGQHIKQLTNRNEVLSVDIGDFLTAVYACIVIVFKFWNFNGDVSSRGLLGCDAV
jgi:hypothetical protein